MKILWLTNYPLPRIADQVGLPRVVNEGWLVGLSELLIEKKWKIVLCSPLSTFQLQRSICWKYIDKVFSLADKTICMGNENS